MLKKLLFIAINSYFLTSCITFKKWYYQPSVPSRPFIAKSSQELMKEMHNMDEYHREIFLLNEFKRGNIPDFLREFQTVKVRKRFSSGKTVTGKLWVSPDYLALGDDSNYIRFPMNPITAQKIADRYDCILPTQKIVDLIYRQADTKLKPITFRPGPKMVRTSQYFRHNRAIQRQLLKRKKGKLIAGHKKDLVISNRLLRKKKRVAIYGWHRPNGKAIQPLSTIHGDYYADYSHGVRLVYERMEINGKMVPIADVLKDPSLASVISYEGVIKNVRYPTEDSWSRKLWFPK